MIEGTRFKAFAYGTANAKQAVLRFGFRGPAGTYSVGVGNQSSARAYCANFVIAAGQANTDTEQVIAIPGDITGTWETGTLGGLWIYFGLAAGTNWTIAPGAWTATNKVFGTGITNNVNVAGNVFELFDVAFYMDTNKTGLAPPYQAPSEAQELQDCQRYLQVQSLIAVTYCGGVSNSHYSWPLPCIMRISPSVSFSSVTLYNSTGPTIYYTNTKALGLYFTSTGTASAGGSFTAWLDARL
jgi:hypothetical protein